MGREGKWIYLGKIAKTYSIDDSAKRDLYDPHSKAYTSEKEFLAEMERLLRDRKTNLEFSPRTSERDMLEIIELLKKRNLSSRILDIIPRDKSLKDFLA